MKSSTVPVFPDLPVNGGVGQGEYQPPVPTLMLFQHQITEHITQKTK